MFGKDRGSAEWVQAQGVVFERSGPRPTSDGGHTDTYTITVRIKFDDGRTTDVKEKLHISKHGFHLEGEAVPVRYDPADHSKAEIDLAELAATRAAAKLGSERAATARVEQALDDVPPAGGPAPSTAPGSANGETESKRLILEVSIRSAQRRGATAEVERWKAELAQLDHGSPTPPESPPSDPLDRLQKLGDLHDRGVLTDAEFAAEKAKILSGEA